MVSTVRTCVIVFAKNPVPNAVKTRLIPKVSPEQAAMLYRAFLMDWCEILTGIDNVDLVIAYTPAGSQPTFQAMLGENVTYVQQIGSDLGERLTSATDWGSKNGYDKIIIVGSDSPTLPLSYISQAIDELDSRDIIVGPSMDGGYYLIAFSVECLDVAVPCIFKDIAWSTQHVFQQTVERIRSVKVSLGLLPPWYDVDIYDELTFLHSHISAMQYSGEVVRTIRTEKILSELFMKENQ